MMQIVPNAPHTAQLALNATMAIGYPLDLATNAMMQIVPNAPHTAQLALNATMAIGYQLDLATNAMTLDAPYAPHTAQLAPHVLRVIDSQLDLVTNAMMQIVYSALHIAQLAQNAKMDMFFQLVHAKLITKSKLYRLNDLKRMNFIILCIILSFREDEYSLFPTFFLFK